MNPLKQLIRHSILSGLLLVTISACGSAGKNVFSRVHPGMSRAELIALVGQPQLRSFDKESETLTYGRANVSERTRYIIRLEQGHVVTMDMQSFPTASPKASANHPRRYDEPRDRDYFPGRMPILVSEQEAWFEELFVRYRQATFDSEKHEILTFAARHGVFSCAQVRKLMETRTFDSERWEILQLLAPSIYDPHNAYRISDMYTFDSEKRKVIQLIEDVHR